MKTTLRLMTLALVVAVALALSGNALAIQKLEVSQTTTSVKIKVSQDPTDPQPAKITAYLPDGYTLNATQAPGTTIGTASGHVIAHDAGNLTLPLTGTVTVADPTAHATDLCSPGVHPAVWDLHLTILGNTLDLFVYVTPTSGQEAALGSARLEICLGPVDVPPTNPLRSPNGAQLLDAVFQVNNVIAPPAGPVRWTSFWTPYAAGTGAPDPAGTVEARSFVGPGAATISARITDKKRKLVTITGSVTQSGVRVVGASVTLLINSKARFKTKTSASGTYTFRLQNTAKKVTTTFFQVKVTAASTDVTSTGCATPTQPPIRCISATSSAFTALTRKVKVRL